MLTLADAMLDKFGGDTIGETRDALERYVARISADVAGAGRAAAGRSPARRVPTADVRLRRRRLRPAMDVVLVGLPGSGKSAVGRRLAHRHGAAFVDLDDVDREGGRPARSRDLRRRRRGGVPGPRARRRSPTSGRPTRSRRSGRVIATGGGAVIDPRNRWALYRRRLPIWLDVRPEVLAQRLRRSPERPAADQRPRPDRDDPRAGPRPGALLRGGRPAERRRRSSRSIVERVDELAAARAGGAGADGRSCAADRSAATSSSARGSRRPRSATALRRAAGPAGRSSSRSRARGRRPATALAAALADDGWPVERVLLPQGEDAKRLAVDRGGRRRARGDSGPSAASRSSRSAAGRSATRPGSWPRPGCAASRSSTSRRRSSPRSIRRSAARPAVDLPEGKNLVGAFHQPAAVVVDIAFLRTLPERQRRAALGEAVKMAALGDERLFELLERDGDAIARGDEAAFASGAVAELVERAAWAKVEVVDGRREGAGRDRRPDRAQPRATRWATRSRRPAGYGERCSTARRSRHGLRAACRIGARARRHAAGAGGADRGAARRASAWRRRRSPTRSTRCWRPLATDKKHAGGGLRWVLPTADGYDGPVGRPGRARRAGRGRVARSGGRRRRGGPAS